MIPVPYQHFIDPTASRLRAVDNGFIYLGAQDTDPTKPENQLPVFYIDENGETKQVSQPILLNSSGVPCLSNGTIYNPQVSTTYASIVLQNKRKVTIYNHKSWPILNQYRKDLASSMGLVYAGEWHSGIVIPNDAMKDKLAYWYNGQFYSVGTDTGFTSTDFNSDLSLGRFISAELTTKIKQWREKGDIRGWGAKCDGSDDIEAIEACAAERTVIQLPAGGVVGIGRTLDLYKKLLIGNDCELLALNNFTGDYHISFNIVDCFNVIFKVPNWDSDCFSGQPLRLVSYSTFHRCEWYAYQKPFTLVSNNSLGPFHSAWYDCRWGYFKEHNIVIENDANNLMFYGGTSNAAGATTYMQRPDAVGIYDGVHVENDQSLPLVSPRGPETLKIIGLDSSYNSRYGFFFNNGYCMQIDTGYSEGNKSGKDAYVGNVVGSSLKFNMTYDGILINVPDNADTQGYPNEIYENGAYRGTGIKSPEFELSSLQQSSNLSRCNNLLSNFGAKPYLGSNAAGEAVLGKMDKTQPCRLKIIDDISIFSTAKSNQFSAACKNEPSGSLPAYDSDYDRTFIYHEATGDLYFGQPGLGWKKIQKEA